MHMDPHSLLQAGRQDMFCPHSKLVQKPSKCNHKVLSGNYSNLLLKNSYYLGSAMHLNDCIRSHMELVCVGSIQSTIFHEDKPDISSQRVLTPFNEVYQIQIEKTESQEQKSLHGPPAWIS